MTFINPEPGKVSAIRTGFSASSMSSQAPSASNSPNTNSVNTGPIGATPTASGSTSTCPGVDQRNVTDSSGVTYTIRCGYDTLGSDISNTQTLNGYSGCFSGCSAIADCAGFTWQSQLNDPTGSGQGQCYFKRATTGSAMTFYNPGNSNNVAAIKMTPPAGTVQISTSTPPASVTSSGPLATGSPTTCPGVDNQNITSSNRVAYSVRCTYDTDGTDLGSGQVFNGWTDCFAYCDATAACAGFTWQSQTNNQAGLGTGYCCYKSYSGSGTLPFKTLTNVNNVAAVKISVGAGSSSPAAIAFATTTTITRTTSAGVFASQSALIRAQDASCPTNDRWNITDSCGIPYILGCYTDTRVGSPGPISGLTSWQACLQACSSGQYASSGACISFTYAGNLCYLKYYDSVSFAFDIFQGSNPNNVAAIQLAYYNAPGPATTATSRVCTFTGSPTIISQTANVVFSTTSTPPGTTSRATQPASPTSAASAPTISGACPSINNTAVSGANGLQYTAYCGSDTSGQAIGTLQQTSTSYQECFAYCDATAACGGFTWAGTGSANNGFGAGNCYFKQDIPQGARVGPFGSGPNLVALVKVIPGSAVTSTAPRSTVTPGGNAQTPLSAAPPAGTSAVVGGSATGSAPNSPNSPSSSGSTYGAAAACPGVDNQVVAGAANVPYRIRCRYDTTGSTFAQEQRTTTSYSECFARCDNNSTCLAFTWLGSGTATNGNGVGSCYFKGLDSGGGSPAFTGDGTNTALLSLIKISDSQAASSVAPGSYTTSYTVYYPSGSTTQAYTQTSIAPSGSAQGTIIVARAIPTTPCLVDGFLSQVNVIYRVNLSNGNMTQFFTLDLGPNPNQLTTGSPLAGVNSLAYNSIDNYLYGTIRGPNPETLIRIGYDGSYQPLLQLPGNSSTYYRYFIGDIDANGQYYTASQQFSQWRTIQVNLNPNLPNYGQIVNAGVTTLPSGGTVQDWAFVPGGGQNLYAIAASENGTATLNAYQLSTGTWITVGTYPGTTITRAQAIDGTGQPQTPRWNALYASSNGYLYGSEGYTGQLWRFSVTPPLNATFVTPGPTNDDADGARCITNTTPL